MPQNSHADSPNPGDAISHSDIIMVDTNPTVPTAQEERDQLPQQFVQTPTQQQQQQQHLLQHQAQQQQQDSEGDEGSTQVLQAPGTGEETVPQAHNDLNEAAACLDEYSPYTESALSRSE